MNLMQDDNDNLSC